MPPRAKTMSEIGRKIDSAANGDSESVAPPIMPPVGIPAQVETKVRYNTTVDPEQEQRRSTGRLYGRESLEDIAAAEAERLDSMPDIPLDPLFAFLEEWSTYAGGQYNCLVYRLPDSGPRRAPGATYRRPYFGPTPENLGTIGFDPNIVNFTADLQALNQYSGGTFQVYLIDVYGRRVDGAVLYSCTIADPLAPPQQQPGNALQYQQQQPPLPRREESEFERDMKEMQRSLMRTTLERAMNPPAPPIAPAASTLTAEEQAKLYVLGQAPQLFPNMFGQLAEMQKSIIEASAASAKEPSWKERGIEAAIALAERNPAIVERLSGTLERLLSMLLPGNSPPSAQYFTPPQQPQQLPAYPPQQPQPYPQPINTAPPAPGVNPGIIDEEDDPEIMDILDQLIKLINSRKVIAANDPVFVQLQKDYPIKFRMAARLIASQPLDEIVAWVSAQSELYESLLTSEVSGEFLRGRIAELQTVFQGAIANAEQKRTTRPIPAPPANIADPTAQAELVNSAAAADEDNA